MGGLIATFAVASIGWPGKEALMGGRRYQAIPLILIAVALCLRNVGSQPYAPAPAEIHCKHFLYGYPLGSPESNDLIVRDCYALSTNDTTKFADWVCYYLTAYEVEGAADPDRLWQNDPWLDADETLEAKPGSRDDYRGAYAAWQYDRGHLAPLASFRGSRYVSQVNFYSNIVPQKSALNQGPWMRLEASERDLVRTYGAAWVMTGPLYEWAMPPLPNCDEFHSVPSGFWKIVAVDDLGTLRIAAFIMEQDTARNSRVIDHLESVDTVQRRSGLDFFWQLPDAEEAVLEAAGNAAWALTWAN